MDVKDSGLLRAFPPLFDSLPSLSHLTVLAFECMVACYPCEWEASKVATHSEATSTHILSNRNFSKLLSLKVSV